MATGNLGNGKLGNGNINSLGLDPTVILKFVFVFLVC